MYRISINEYNKKLCYEVMDLRLLLKVDTISQFHNFKSLSKRKELYNEY